MSFAIAKCIHDTFSYVSVNQIQVAKMLFGAVSDTETRQKMMQGDQWSSEIADRQCSSEYSVTCTGKPMLRADTGVSINLTEILARKVPKARDFIRRH